MIFFIIECRGNFLRLLYRNVYCLLIIDKFYMKSVYISEYVVLNVFMKYLLDANANFICFPSCCSDRMGTREGFDTGRHR